MANTYFGPPFDAPAWGGSIQTKTPVGQHCYQCGEEVVDGDRGWIHQTVTTTGGAVTLPIHAECQFAAVFGHHVGACSCHMPEVSIRELGRIAWERFQRNA